jgi:hypothetical protein
VAQVNGPTSVTAAARRTIGVRSSRARSTAARQIKKRLRLKRGANDTMCGGQWMHSYSTRQVNYIQYIYKCFLVCGLHILPAV